jgi:hypothetical protein
MKIISILLLALALTACAPATQTEPPTTTPSGEAIRRDAQAYAEQMGVTLEEAIIRLNRQNEGAIGELGNELERHEAATFAGLWLQHQPEYRVVVAFTRDGEETIRRYVAANSDLFPLIELRAAQYSLAQLKADQRTTAQMMETAGLSAAISIDLIENRVVVYATDRAAFDASLSAAGATLPASVFVDVVYEPVGETPPFAITPVPDLFMAQLKQRDAMFMAALLVGELRVEDGCLRVRTARDSLLIIWQADYYLTNNNGLLEILDETGAPVAQVGEAVYMGGGGQPEIQLAELREPLPIACGGPYWRMGGFLPEEYIPNVTDDSPPRLETYTDVEIGLAFDYPVGWYLHKTDKMVQISPNAQPVWSSFFDPNEPHGGPYFNLAHNLNRQMAAEPLAEIEYLLEGYAGMIEPLYPAAALRGRSDVALGAYRFVGDEGMVLLVGAAVNPVSGSSQPVVSLTAVVKQTELIEMQAIFAGILRSLRPADS